MYIEGLNYRKLFLLLQALSNSEQYEAFFYSSWT